MSEVVSVVLDGAEGYAAETVYFQNMLGARGRSDDENVGFFAHADLIASAVEGFALEVGVE